MTSSTGAITAFGLTFGTISVFSGFLIASSTWSSFGGVTGSTYFSTTGSGVTSFLVAVSLVSEVSEVLDVDLEGSEPVSDETGVDAAS